MIALDHVTKTFGDRSVIADVSFRINPGEFVCISGPSSCGKTVLVEMLVGAMLPTSGTVSIDSMDLRKVPAVGLQLYRRRLGIVFQDLKLLPQYSVAENILYPLEICGAPDTWSSKRVKEVLAAMDLTAQANMLPAALSAGERARLAVARAIAHKPLIVIADEPTGNLDPAESTGILQMLRMIHATGTTVILLTHDTALVDVLQTRVIRMEAGKIIRDSVGGYERAKRNQPQAAREATHEFFGKENVEHLMQEEHLSTPPPLPEEDPPEEAPAPVAAPIIEEGHVRVRTKAAPHRKPAAGGSTGKRKIHITSINS